jgi:hypothetical protein
LCGLEPCLSVVILCGFGTVLVSVYNLWFGNNFGYLLNFVDRKDCCQWLYCVVFEQCLSVVIFFGCRTVLLNSYILWFENSVC